MVAVHDNERYYDKVQLAGLFNDHLEGLTETAVVAWAFENFDPSQIVMTTSFGRGSAVLLSQVLETFPKTPVVFIDPGDVPKNNLKYRDYLVEKLNIFLVEDGPDWPITDEEAKWLKDGQAGKLLFYARRKVPFLERTLTALHADAVFHGNRRDQNPNRSTFKHLEPHYCGWVRVYPNLRMTAEAAMWHLKERGIKRHKDGWPGGARDECGIHRIDRLPILEMNGAEHET